MLLDVCLDVEAVDWSAACARLPWLAGAAEELLKAGGPFAVAELFAEHDVPFRLSFMDVL